MFESIRPLPFSFNDLGHTGGGAPSRRATARRALAAAAFVGVGLVGAGCGGVQTTGELDASTSALSAEHEAARLRLLDDYELAEGPFDLPLRRGGRSVVVRVEPGWCYAFFATADSGVRDLDMEVFDEAGRTLGADTMFDATPFVQHCADRGEAVTVDVRVARGSGDAVFSVGRKPD